jgi:bacillithiol biosynthesis deacetylase BshB1
MSDAAQTQLDVIAVGAHPDDVEIGCGGTLALLAEQGYRVGVVDLTDGEPTPNSPGPESRLAEAAEAGQILGLSHRITLDLTNRALFDSFEARAKLASVFRQYRPRLVLGLGDRTPMASPDHWQAMQITDAAVFYSRLTKWDERFGGFSPHRIDAQLYYFLGFANMHMRSEFSHRLIVDISKTWEKKLAAVRAYRSQFPAEKHHIFGRMETHARDFGEAAGIAHGELLVSPRPVATEDVMKTLFRTP